MFRSLRICVNVKKGGQNSGSRGRKEGRKEFEETVWCGGCNDHCETLNVIEGRDIPKEDNDGFEYGICDHCVMDL
ncbi:MAG: hypothetical protein ABSH06_10085 [Thermodesulfobacteriota bacterium]